MANIYHWVWFVIGIVGFVSVVHGLIVAFAGLILCEYPKGKKMFFRGFVFFIAGLILGPLGLYNWLKGLSG
jgi:bacteriorhodopsin